MYQFLLEIMPGSRSRRSESESTFSFLFNLQMKKKFPIEFYDEQVKKRPCWPHGINTTWHVEVVSSTGARADVLQVHGEIGGFQCHPNMVKVLSLYVTFYILVKRWKNVYYTWWWCIICCMQDGLKEHMINYVYRFTNWCKVGAEVKPMVSNHISERLMPEYYKLYKRWWNILTVQRSIDIP